MPRPVNETFIKEIQSNFSDVKTKEPLERHTTFRLPATAAVFVRVSSLTEELIPLLDIIKKNDIKHIILGGGSNLIFASRFYDGIVIKPEGDFKKIIRTGEDTITAGAGAMLPTVEAFATQVGLSGFESLSGIPGTVGGALVINAGTKYGSISETLSEATALDENLEVRKMRRDEIEFSYRNSSLKNFAAVISATFALKKSKPSEILKKIDSIMKERSVSQPHLPSAGCIFKNPSHPAPPAGKLIESCNLKGLSKGGAKISEEHANFIVNTGGATVEDVMYLVELIRRKVFEKYGINLDTEVEIIK